VGARGSEAAALRDEGGATGGRGADRCCGLLLLAARAAREWRLLFAGRGTLSPTSDLKMVMSLRAVPTLLRLVPGDLTRSATSGRNELGALGRGKPLTDEDGHVSDDALRRSPPWRRR
jgi:hypothetical protein